MSSPRIGSLFSGYGGLDMGVTAALGGSVAWHVEFDKAPSKILAHHWPDVPNYGDVTAVDWSQVEPVDVITGGSPCQDLSHAGKRQGMTEGTRSNLWVAMREAIAQLRPGLVVWENVRGAYSAAADSEVEQCAGCMGDPRDRGPALRALGRVLGDLSDLGYDCRWHGLRAADVGAPHGRFRVFVVAYPNSAGRGGVRWLHSVGHHLDGRGIADGLRSTTKPSALLGTPRASEWKGSGPVGSKSHAHMLDREYLSTQVLSLLQTPSVSDATGGHLTRGGTRSNEELLPGQVRSLSSQDWGIYADAIAHWEALTRPAPAPTQPSKKGTPQLSPAFSEWLMGLPGGHVTGVPGLSRNDMLKALGNGVVPQQAEAALRFLLGAEAVAA